MQETLKTMADSQHPKNLLSFEEIKDIVGFNDYYLEEERYIPRKLE